MIVGAGTFGASLAWWLAGRGDDVVLVDQFEPGDARATSGGETRLIRCSHGADDDYSAMARRARTLWRDLEAESGADLLSECGVAWFAHREDGWEAESERVLGELGVPTERWSVEQAAARFPSFRGDDLTWVLHEPEAGVLRAQLAVQTLASAAAARGARIVHGRARPDGDARRPRGRHGARRRPRRVELRRLARAALPRPRAAARHLPGAVLLRRRPGVERGARLGRLRPRVLRNRRRRRARREGRVGRRRPAAGPRRRPAGDERRARSAHARLRRRPLPGARAGAAGGLQALPLRALARFALHRGAASAVPPRCGSSAAAPGHGFKHGPAMAERVCAAWHDGAELPARFALGPRARGTSLRSAGSNV